MCIDSVQYSISVLELVFLLTFFVVLALGSIDRKSTRLNSSHVD